MFLVLRCSVSLLGTGMGLRGGSGVCEVQVLSLAQENNTRSLAVAGNAGDHACFSPNSRLSPHSTWWCRAQHRAQRVVRSP